LVLWPAVRRGIGGALLGALVPCSTAGGFALAIEPERQLAI